MDGTDPTLAFLILSGERPVGFIQCYRLDDNPDYARAVEVDQGAGVDLFIGEAEVMGGGFGSTVLRRFVDDIVWPPTPIWPAAWPGRAYATAAPNVPSRRPGSGGGGWRSSPARTTPSRSWSSSAPGVER